MASRRAAVMLGCGALAVALGNAALLTALVPEQRMRVAAFALALALGPAVALASVARRFRGWRAAAWAAFGLYATGSIVTGFSVGLWNLLLGVPLCLASILVAPDG